MAWFGVFSFGRYPWWNLKVPDVWASAWGFLVEGGYQSSVAVVAFCASGRPMDCIWGSCTRDVEAVVLLAGIVCCKGFLIGEARTFGLWCL